MMLSWINRIFEPLSLGGAATPAVLLPDHTQVRLRPLLRSDGRDWAQARILDEAWLKPVEPTVRGSWQQAHSPAAWRAQWASLQQLAYQGSVVALVIEVDGVFAGQVTLGGIQHGTVDECWIGYWVHSPFMGKGVAKAACALGVDYAFARVRVHRVTATYLPSNPASGKVLRANGFIDEGMMRRNIHIDGQWRDHHFLALTADDYSYTAVQRLRQAREIL